MRRRGALLAGFVARTRGGRLRRRVMFREVIGGKGLSCKQEKYYWMGCLEEDPKAFGIRLERVARGSTECPSVGSCDRGRGGSFYAERARCGEN